MATARKPVSEVPRRTPDRSSASPGFVTAAGGSAVSVSPGKGGQNTGMPTVCSSKRAAPNVRSY